MGIGYYSACKKCKKFIHIGHTGFSRNPLNLENSKMSDFVIRHASSCGQEYILPLIDDFSDSEDISLNDYVNEGDNSPTVSHWKNRILSAENMKDDIGIASDELVSKVLE